MSKLTILALSKVFFSELNKQNFCYQNGAEPITYQIQMYKFSPLLTVCTDVELIVWVHDVFTIKLPEDVSPLIDNSQHFKPILHVMISDRW